MKIKVLVATSLLMLTVVSFAWAPYPQIVPDLVKAELQGDKSLKVTWQEVNLRPGAFVTYTVSSTAPATYACVNSSGNCITTQYVSSGGAYDQVTFQANKKGVINGTAELNPPAAPDTYTCGSGQTMILSKVAYGGITVYDQTNFLRQVAVTAYVVSQDACN